MMPETFWIWRQFLGTFRHFRQNTYLFNTVHIVVCDKRHGRATYLGRLSTESWQGQIICLCSSGTVHKNVLWRHMSAIAAKSRCNCTWILWRGPYERHRLDSYFRSPWQDAIKARCMVSDLPFTAEKCITLALMWEFWPSLGRLTWFD